MMKKYFKKLSVAVIATMLLTSGGVQGETLHASNAYNGGYVGTVATLPAPQMVSIAKKDKDGRQAFQARVFVNPQSTGVDTSFASFPAGKRLVIENVSAIARRPQGLQVELHFFTYLDSNGDGAAAVEEITFHRITLTEQGVFDGVQISNANHMVQVFADISQIGVGGRLNGTTTGSVQIQVTFSGYLEDLPTGQ
jgi:hypothetical protein